MPSGPTHTTALSLRNLRKSYGGVAAVDGLCLEVRAGECFGLLGPNGAGKTTTLEICEGLTTPDSGQVLVLGKSWTSAARDLRQRLGIQLQETQFADKLSVLETITLFRSFFRRGLDPEALMRTVHLESKSSAWVGQLSGGQKQRLALACALAGDPDLLFLDEPTTGLDPQARRHLWDLVHDFKLAGRTIILSTHYMAEAEALCDRVAILDGGKIIASGSPRQLSQSLGGEHIVRFTVGLGAGALDLAVLTRIEGVFGVNRDGAAVSLRVASLHECVPALLGELARQDVHLESLQTHSATLDDVFIAITGRAVRDV